MGWSDRTIVTTRREYLVPLGSAWAVFDKAWNAAAREAEKQGKDVRTDDWATVTADDDYVIICVTVDKEED